VDIPKVFGGFEMKKELQKKYKETETIRTKLLDSLSFHLQILSTKVRANKDDKELMYEFDVQRQDFFKRKKQIEEDNAALSAQYDKQILEQMSQYVMDYGKKNKYDLIFGTDGNGTLMFANEKYNISEDVTNYINDKYKGIE
jgi:outer membrane protein